MTQSASTWRELHLWPHQTDAVELVLKYVTSGSNQSALICMPTGTGKSGVIAVLAKCIPFLENVLIVSPFVALRRQIAEEIKGGRFWRLMGADSWPKDVRVFMPSQADAVLQSTQGQPTVYICTIQSLHKLYTEYPKEYQALKDRIDVVAFDEGHREPAREWAEAIRTLEKPTVLFTATPYRNDHKLFSVDPQYIYRLRYQEAVKKNYIRQAIFREVPFDQTPESFVDALLGFFDGDFQSVKPVQEPRVIVRCETGEAVNEITAALKRRGRSAVGIHERFEDSDDDDLVSDVPDPGEERSTFWVHQHKLTEGIDHPSFALLAIYQPLRNGRALVQQVGRILRNPDCPEKRQAYVLCRPDDRQRLYWDNFLQYESQADESLNQLAHRALFETALTSQPGYQYFEGNYRQRFDPESDDAFEFLSYPLTCSIFSVDVNFDLGKFQSKLLEEWADADRDVRNTRQIEEAGGVHLYTAYGNSPVLKDHVFLEFRLGFTVYMLRGSFLFYYDSQGAVCEYLQKHSSRVSPQKLQSLFQIGSRVSRVSLINSDIGRYSVRRRTVDAYDISDTAPSLFDHAHFCSTASGTASGKHASVRRYVGFTRAKVRDTSGGHHTLDEYREWIDGLADRLCADAGASMLFGRFSPHIDPPVDNDATNILLDLEDVKRTFTRVGTGVPLEVTDLCVDITGVREDQSFTLMANGEPCKVSVTYEPKQRIYKLASRKLELSYTREEYSGRRRHDNLISYLNQEQAFRLVLSGSSLIYAHGHFYDPRLTVGGLMEINALFRPVGKLALLTSEKGADGSATGDSWSESSVFGLIHRFGKGTELADAMGGIDLLICDDMQTEVADFIGVNADNDRVVFIHAKALDGSMRSASAFHEVCSQAVKNLSYFHPYSSIPDRNVSRWAGAWEGGSVGVVNSRIQRRRPDDTSDAAQRVRTAVRNPGSVREVWIVLGAGFSVGEFERVRRWQNPPPEIVQIDYLLTSTWSAVSSVGARLRVFCSP